MNRSKITVLMPVYNEEKYIAESIDSILNQSYENFEFLIINDRSTDKSIEIISNYNDSRIRIINNKKKLGLSRSLNKGIKLANGQYIVRMDADDISLPERLTYQVEFMNRNPEIGICGTWIKTFGFLKEKIWRYPINSHTVKIEMLFNSPIGHPTVIMRKELLNKFGLCYSRKYTYAQDYNLWGKTVDHFPCANIGEVLLLFRTSRQKFRRYYRAEFQKFPKLIRQRQLRKLGINPTKQELNFHQKISLHKLEINDFSLRKIEAWFEKLKEANQKSKRYPEILFSKFLDDKLKKFNGSGFDLKRKLRPLLNFLDFK